MKDEREVANKDHTAKTWMRDSIVWYSQRITKKLGKKRFQQYLDAFDYGNRDFDDGLTTAWWKPAPDAKGAIQISAYEQVEFLKKLWKGTLLAKPRAMKLARETTYLETSPNGYKLHGKTGSNFFDKKRDRRQGWFIAHLERGGEEYIVVTNFSDSKPTDEKGYGGLRAKEITKQILAEEGLW